MKTGAIKKLVVRGPTKIQGEVNISGAKNSALPILAACILTQETIKLTNIPKLRDITSMLEVLSSIKTHICLTDDDILHINAQATESLSIEEALTKKTRASILLLGPLLARFKRASIALPGGCNIGKRPIDMHIDGLTALGAHIEVRDNIVHASCDVRGLTGGTIHLPKPSVGATENLLMAATLARGTTVLSNIALEPEIFDLVDLLRGMGACIRHDKNTLIIEGKEKLNGYKHNIIGDRLEAGTYLIAAAATGGEVITRHVNPDHLGFVLARLTECGASITTTKDSIHLKMKSHPRAITIETAPFPGFPTDLQAQWLTLNIIAEGNSQIKETIFENRASNVYELRKLGAELCLDSESSEIQISGGCYLTGDHVEAKDLRASAGLIIAGLAAHGCTHIHNTDFIDRGYVALEEKFRKLGADIHRTQSSD